jgi:hypothetical protein
MSGVKMALPCTNHASESGPFSVLILETIYVVTHIKNNVFIKFQYEQECEPQKVLYHKILPIRASYSPYIIMVHTLAHSKKSLVNAQKSQFSEHFHIWAKIEV